MLFDLHDLDDVSVLEADVCIVGAGAAGISLARELARLGRSVCLLEGGDFDFDAETQALYKGDNTGFEYYELEHSRLRFFGGTTNIWGGRCALLDDIDFQTRDWVPHSGWPFARSVLEPWYRKAHDQLELGEYNYENDVWAALGIQEDPLPSARLDTRLWRFDEVAERFAHARCRDLIDSELIKVCLHANVVHLQANEDATGLSHLVIRSLNGPAHPLKARTYVLAAGGIENARLLLCSRDVETQGIGNSHDQVGRYFMEHPHGRIGQIHTDRPFELWDKLQKRFPPVGPPLAPVLRLSDSTQQATKALNSVLTFKLQRDPKKGVPLNKRLYLHLKHELNPTSRGRTAHHAFRALKKWIHKTVRAPLERWRANSGRTALYAIVRAEQAPDPASRVMLSDQLDALGCPRVSLEWRLNAQDKASVVALGQTLDQELRRLGLGSLELSDWLQNDTSLEWPVDPTVSNHPIGGYHHMGTTRMSQTSGTGVVDGDCRVHGYANLYIAGSSVFPTGGWANPTLTIVALSLRLADHLAAELGQMDSR